MINFNQHKIAVVIPYYKAAAEIVDVIAQLPEYISDVIIVDDNSPDALPEQEISTRIHSNIHTHVLQNETNLGVGGATKKGFEKAIALHTDFVIKVDADNQMDLSYIPDLLTPLLMEQADMAKGNRFRDFEALKKMPLFRRIGNLGLSFLIKAATGYWQNFDPVNGFFAIKTSVLKQCNFSKLAHRYYFETSLLAELYFQKARIKDIAMPAIYGDEKSNMQLWKMPFIFTPKLISTFITRMVKGYFLYDFNPGSIYLLFGVPLFFFGFFFGIYTWIYHSTHHILTPTGTIMIVTLSIILGFQLNLQAIQYDIINAPKADS